MKRLSAVILFVSILCGVSCNKGSKDKFIVGATPVPHAEMLHLVKDDLKKDGIEMIVKEFTDYTTPNEALESGEISANFFQHIPYMESFNRERGFHLSSAGSIHIEPLALYSKKYTSIKEIKKGAKVAIPNDPTNEGRALLLLQSAGLIALSQPSLLEATPKDVVKNQLGLKFVEMDAASIPLNLKDIDAAVINGNYAMQAGLSPAKDGLFVENSDSPYVNVVAVKQGNEENPNIKALIKALTSKRVKDWIKAHYPNGEVVSVF